MLKCLRNDKNYVPELKRKGYGKILLDDSLEKANELGCFLCKELISRYLDGITGEYATSKEKLKLPGRLI